MSCLSLSILYESGAAHMLAIHKYSWAQNLPGEKRTFNVECSMFSVSSEAEI